MFRKNKLSKNMLSEVKRVITNHKDEQWFIDRIGKRVYRNKLSCDCVTCREVERDGVVVHNIEHAKLLYTGYCDFNYEGTYIDYRDEPF